MPASLGSAGRPVRCRELHWSITRLASRGWPRVVASRSERMPLTISSSGSSIAEIASHRGRAEAPARWRGHARPASVHAVRTGSHSAADGKIAIRTRRVPARSSVRAAHAWRGSATKATAVSIAPSAGKPAIESASASVKTTAASVESSSAAVEPSAAAVKSSTAAMESPSATMAAATLGKCGLRDAGKACCSDHYNEDFGEGGFGHLNPSTERRVVSRWGQSARAAFTSIQRQRPGLSADNSITFLDPGTADPFLQYLTRSTGFSSGRSAKFMLAIHLEVTHCIQWTYVILADSSFHNFLHFFACL